MQTVSKEQQGFWRTSYLLFILAFILSGLFIFSLRSTLSLNHQTNSDFCENTGLTTYTSMHGDWITDDRGVVCKLSELNFKTGCCNFTFVENICVQCNQTAKCCEVYEFCVACCLQQIEDGFVNDIIDKNKDNQLYLSLLLKGDIFGFCRAQCRTYSKSVIGENKYRSHVKYCYGSHPPPLTMINGDDTFINENLIITNLDKQHNDNNNNIITQKNVKKEKNKKVVVVVEGEVLYRDHSSATSLIMGIIHNSKFGVWSFICGGFLIWITLLLW